MTLHKFAAARYNRIPLPRIFNAFYLLLIASVGLSGCATDPTWPGSDSRPLAGVYDGTLSDTGAAAMRAGALATEQGEFRLLGSNGLQVVAQLERQGDLLRGDGRVYAPSGEAGRSGSGRLPDGTQSAPARIEARVLPRGLVAGNYVGGGQQGRFSLQRLPVSERGGSLEALAGNYRSARQGSSFEGAIDNLGRLRGRDQHGVYNGRFEVLDPGLNLYRVHVTYRPFNDLPLDLSGLGTLNDDQADNDRGLLQFQLSNEARQFFSQLRKVP